jgi:hypothetical protein
MDQKSSFGMPFNCIVGRFNNTTMCYDGSMGLCEDATMCNDATIHSVEYDVQDARMCNIGDVKQLYNFATMYNDLTRLC